MNKNLIEIKNISLSYEDKPIFEDLSLDIPYGKIIAILGPSGCGKTSFLRLISRLMESDSGSIFYKGIDIAEISEGKMQKIRQEMGFMFQSNALFTDMNVFENIAYPIRVHSSLPESLIRTIVLIKLQMVGLRGAYYKMPHELSGGMARRVALARSLAIDPTLMLYDEPFTGQDPISMKVLLRLIKHINSCLNMTSIIVSHDVEEVCRIADYVYMFESGKIVAQGVPEELLQSKDKKVSQFMRGQLEGDMPFHYPAVSYFEDLINADSFA
ncbi:MAG TPA: phospholipid ABC transporter ATP-binding protein MlaF [Legionellales bacterium]|nr:phospholipid ABC transporter ATP-binding protein MlaF [Legionellales bacterium]